MPKNERNTTRRNGKRLKKNPGVSARAYTGKTTDGYSPAALARRAARRTAPTCERNEN